MFRMMLSAVALVPFRASDMQMAYTALQAWLSADQVFAAGRGIMRDMFLVFIGFVLITLLAKSRNKYTFPRRGQTTLQFWSF
jgi:hypothetical protein